MDFTPVFDFLIAQFPVSQLILSILGALVVVATVIDSLVDDSKDHGFSKKLLSIPILGELLKQVKRFSPFNVKEEPKEEKPEEPKE